MRTLSIFVTKNAKAIVVIWLLFFIVMAFFATQLSSKLEGDGFTINGDHKKVTEQLSEEFGLPAKTIFVLFNNKTDAEIEQTLTDLETLKDINTIESPLENKKLKHKDIAYAMLHFNNEVTDYPTVVKEIRSTIGTHSGIEITGEPVISTDINKASQNDLAQAETIGLPIALIVLLLAFGTIVASILPIVIGGITVITTFGILSILGNTLDLSIFVLNIVPMLGLALSIDFALLFINRYREERNQKTIEQSIQIAIQTAGRSIIFSALCVMIGLGAMVVIKVDIFQNIALGGAIVVLIAVIAGLTLLPATMMLLGNYLEKWRLFRVKSSGSSFWKGFSGFVMKRPITIVLLSVIILSIGILPLKNIELAIPGANALPQSFEARKAFDKLQEEFGLKGQSQLYLLAEREDGWNNQEGYQKILEIQKKLQHETLVDNVTTIFTVTKLDSAKALTNMLAVPQAKTQLQPALNTFIQGKQMFIPITLNAEGSSNEAQDFVRAWMNKDLGVEFALGGQPKFNQEIFDEISNKIVKAIMIIVVSTFIILLIAFRSILIPIKAILMNIFGLSAAFGILVYIFQYGHFGMEASNIALIIPVIVFCLVFGLSMDYEVFLISRIQEEYLRGADNTRATIDGLTSTSRIITSAALIMIVITGAFAFTNVMPVKQIGVGIAVAIAIDATIIRLMLVPSLMKLFGDLNWWLPFRKAR